MNDKPKDKPLEGLIDVANDSIRKPTEPLIEQKTPKQEILISGAYRQAVFQKRTEHLRLIDPAQSLEKSYLFLICGPTGAGKSTIEEAVNSLLDTRLEQIPKDQTRLTRVLDCGRQTISKREFKRRKKQGEYIFSYSTRYEDNYSQVQDVFYGISHTMFARLLNKNDSILSLTDPDSYAAFNSQKIQSLIRRYASVVPIVVITDSSEDLITRLEGRMCAETERQRRLRQAERQWTYFKEVIARGDVTHVLVNNTPQSLKNIPLDQNIPEAVETETHQAIDRTTRQLANILSFYRGANRGIIQHDRSDYIIVHDLFFDYILTNFFGGTQEDISQALSSKKHLALRSSEEIKARIKRRTGNSAFVDHVFDTLRAKRSEEKNGILTIYFNNMMFGTDSTDFRSIINEIIPGYGFWLPESDTKRYSLTDRPSFSKSIYPYAIDMKFVKHI